MNVKLNLLRYFCCVSLSDDISLIFIPYVYIENSYHSIIPNLTGIRSHTQNANTCWRNKAKRKKMKKKKIPTLFWFSFTDVLLINFIFFLSPLSLLLVFLTIIYPKVFSSLFLFLLVFVPTTCPKCSFLSHQITTYVRKKGPEKKKKEKHRGQREGGEESLITILLSGCGLVLSLFSAVANRENVYTDDTA